MEKFIVFLQKFDFVSGRNKQIERDTISHYQLANEIRPNLGSDFKAVHQNRLRCCDVWDFKFDQSPDKVHLESALESRLFNFNGHSGVREYPRIHIHTHPYWSKIGRFFIQLGVLSSGKSSGKIRLEFFETYGHVVSKFHQDSADFVALYCISKEGCGAETQISRDNQGQDIIWKKELVSGDWLFFNDRKTYHYTSPLKANSQHPCPKRLILACLILFDDKGCR